MKLKCYGTAAAEAIPGLYCSCAVCEQARALGGKEIRGRHLSTVDEDIQFDIGPDFFHQIQLFRLEPRNIRHLIITHTHSDHFSPTSLSMRVPPYAKGLNADMALIGSEKTIEIAAQALDNKLADYKLLPRIAMPFEPLRLDEQTLLTALPANHAPGLGAMIYLLERGGKRLLYGHDTGVLFPEVVAYLAGKQLDAATLDCTGVYNGAGAHHMTLSVCEATVSALLTNGGLKPNATIILNHFSHGGGALHWQLEQEAAARGWITAYDGIQVDI